jgi:thioesterase domain-containing protein/acyl-coenzyme A synthetase/AMP-(fatty) acid ligase/acyl carrier protein
MSNGAAAPDDDVALFMLTSGSTGDCKAVQFTHTQILSAIKGKVSVRQLPSDGSFLNWLGLDHVASLVEIHLQATYLGVDQIHVPTPDVVSSPRFFLELLSSHRVSRSFAPNFFLARLVADVSSQDIDCDLSNLTVLASGGEANDTQTTIDAARLLEKMGASPSVITPGFGMTETCAGAIFNLECPRHEIENKLSCASLGKCIEGIEMRITLPTDGDTVTLASAGTSGNLEVRGPVIFRGYYHNEHATRLAFTPDGWFRTGDTGTIDGRGYLHLTGRTKDIMNINGLKINPDDIQGLVDRTLIPQVKRVVIFPTRSETSSSERITGVFIPSYWPLDVKSLVDIQYQINQACVACTGSSAVVFALPEESLLPISTLGKVSRGKLKSLFESGAFKEYTDYYNTALDSYRLETLTLPRTEVEAWILRNIAEVINIPLDRIGIDTPFFNLGYTSMDLIRLKRLIDKRLQTDVPIISIMKYPTARQLADALNDIHTIARQNKPEPPSTYNPVVAFKTDGKQTPLWLIHPGVGEVLVFFGLAKELADEDRPIYALRARGFEHGQDPFTSIADAVKTYQAAIKEHQPEGPYAIAGYSFGAMLAFEVAKELEGQNKGCVKFLGSFNLPPHIKTRMRQLNWNMCLLHLTYFLGLVSEAYAEDMDDGYRFLSRQEATVTVLAAADKRRLVELGLDGEKLESWVNVAFGLQSMAVDFEPRGAVSVLDVFHAIPLKTAASSRTDWIKNHLAKWEDFCESPPRFHEVSGAHYTMLSPDHVVGFAKTLRAALKFREL